MSGQFSARFRGLTLTTAITCAISLGCGPDRAPEPSLPIPPAIVAPIPLTDDALEAAVRALLLDVAPWLPTNAYLPPFAKDKLQWLTGQFVDGKLNILFLAEAQAIGLPADVLMAAARIDGQPTIYVAKPRFAALLREEGAEAPPFPQRIKNDFVLGLVHEVVHLQNPSARASDPVALATEEARAWREVTLGAVRSMRASGQPMDRGFLRADDALLACRDRLPCPLLAGVVRLTR